MRTQLNSRRPTPDFELRRPSHRWPLVLALAATGAASLSVGGGQGTTNLTVKAEITAKETYDSNVYLQDHEPDRHAVPKAAQPFQESFVSAVTPKLALDWKPCTAFNAAVSYAPEVAFYHSEPSENYVANRGLINLGGNLGDVQWEAPNAITFIDGDNEGLYYGVSSVPGKLDGVPAIGGIPVRDRRDQFVYRGGLKATWSTGKFFLRPAFSAYVHDFLTEQKLNAESLPNGQRNPNWGYENYVDRSALDVGLDAGWLLNPQTKLFVGYRYGNEIEGTMVGSRYHYDAQYHRPLVGLEGKPAKWLTANFSIGPEIQHTTSDYAPEFDPDYTRLWVDGVVTLAATAKDNIVLTWKQFTQPAFSSPSVYEDTVYEVAVRHRFDGHWTAGGGFRAYLGNWFEPVDRKDWIYTPSASIAYKHDAHLSAELGYSYDWVDSRVPDTEGREYTRHLVWLSAKYSF